MNALYVSDRVGFLPGQLQIQILEHLLENSSHHLKGVLLLDDINLSFLKFWGRLGIGGARHLSLSAYINFFSCVWIKKEELCRKKNVEVVVDKTVNSQRVVDWVKFNQIDVIVHNRTKMIFRKEILDAPRIGCINVHHGLLPEQRGALCDLYSMAEGVPTGFTIHVMDEKIDNGAILFRKDIPSPQDKNYMRYLEDLTVQEAKALSTVLEEIGSLGRFPEGIPNIRAGNKNRKIPTPDVMKGFRRSGVAC